MPDDTQPTEGQQPSTPVTGVTPTPPSDATLNADKGQDKQKPETEKQTHVPIVRFEEVNTRMKAAEEKLAKFEREQAAAEKKQKEEAGQWQDLYKDKEKEVEELKPYRERYEKMEQMLLAANKSRIESIPEDKRSLVPTQLDPVAQFEWLNTNLALLTVPKAPNTDAGVRGDTPKIDVKLSAEEMDYAKTFGLKPEDYARAKAAKPK